MENLYTRTIEFLKRNKEYAIKSNDNGVVLDYIKINKHIEELTPELINYLAGDTYFFENYFKKIGDVHVFNQNLIMKILFKYKEYMMGSVTSYDNKIGLFIQDNDQVVLNFPYKDCVLVGGMDSEDEKIGTEFFYNEILDKDKISKLFQPKVFHNAKKFSYVKSLAVDDDIQNTKNIQVENDIESIDFKDGKLNDNLLMKGNNLLALHSLSERLSNGVDVIYIDPPYYFSDKDNSDAFAYNSNFKFSTWLTFMKNRLEVAKELLNDDGVIFISMNEKGSSHLKLLCDDIFKENNFIEKFNWEQTQHFGRQKTNSYVNSENIITYAKNKYNGEKIKELLVEYQKTDFEDAPLYNASNPNKTLIFPKGKVKFNIKDGEYTVSTNDKYKLMDKVIVENGFNKNDLKINFKARWQQSTVKDEIDKGTIFWVKTDGFSIRAIYGNGKIFNESPRKIIFTNKSNNLSTKILNKRKVGTTEEGSNMLKLLGFKESDFPYPKPVSLIEYLISLLRNKNAVVMDFFAGSGTTAQSVLSLNKEDGGNRKFILVEQMDYIENITAERIRRCMIKEGYEDSFVYLEMFESEIKKIKKQIKLAESIKDLEDIVNKVFDTGCFININSKSELLLEIKNRKNINDAKKILLEGHMDNNLDYISYSDIEELKYKNLISENEYKLNKDFYNGGDDE